MNHIPSNIPDDELSALVAENVAGWRFYGTHWKTPDKSLHSHPRFAVSADAVLPLLETHREHGWGTASKVVNGDYELRIFGEGHSFVCASTLPRAACLALLAAKGFTITSP